MSGVVLRCPTCGTTQVKPGECEACFEGTVRYFCDNHSPGLWLDAAVCKACGATVGRAAPKAPERSRPVGASVPVHKTRRPGAAASGAPRRGEPSPGAVRRPPPREFEPEEAPAAPSLRDLLAHLATERDRPAYEVETIPPPAPELPRRAPFVAGCLLRLVLLVLFLIVLAVTGLLVLFGGLFQ